MVNRLLSQLHCPFTEVTELCRNKPASLGAANAVSRAKGQPPARSGLTWCSRLSETGCLLLESFVVATIQRESYRGWSEDIGLLKKVAL